MPDDFEVGPSGLPLYRLADWRALVVERWQAAYGPDADTRPETPDGLLVDTLALLMTLLGEAAQGVYAGSFFRTAAAPQLDLLLDMFGRSRYVAQPTVVEAVWYGTTDTVVHDGVGVGPVAVVASEGPSDGDRYQIPDGTAALIPDPDDPGAPVVYEVIRTIDGDGYGIAFDGLEQMVLATSDDPQALVEALAAEVVSTWSDFAVTTGPSSTPGRWVMVVLGKGAAVVTQPVGVTDTGNAAIYGGILVATEAEIMGAQQCLAGTLSTIGEPVGGLAGVHNPADGVLGRGVESDQAFRQRHMDQINVGGRATPQRIRAAVLSELPDPLVEYARVDENTSGVTVAGRPPHSFEVTWIGTATAEQVATVVLDHKPAGIRAFGSSVVAVQDALGDSHLVGVSQGTELFLHLNVEVTAGEGFPTTGDREAAITEAIVTVLEDRLGLGTDLYLVWVVAAVVDALDGVAAVTVETAATLAPDDDPDYHAADVTVASTAILRVDSTRVTVTIV